MKLRIDAEACTGHGRCYVLAPTVFETDDEGHSVGLFARSRRKLSPVKLRIDAEACTGHGRCYVLAPEVFEPDDEGHSVGSRRGRAATNCSTRRRLAVANCPESAITLVD